MRSRQSLRFAALTASLLWASVPALACVPVAELKLDGYPGDGAEDVPLDVVPIYQRSRGEQESNIPVLVNGDGGVGSVPVHPPFTAPEVTLSHAGGSVAVSIRAAQYPYFEIVPEARLLPDTQYTLAVSWQERESSFRPDAPVIEEHDALTFRTGKAVYRGDASAPTVFASQYIGKGVTTCDPPERAVCFSLPDDDALYVAQFDGEPLITLERGSFFNNRPFVAPALDCMRIKRRAPNGRLSDEVVNCRDERPVYDLELLPAPASGESIDLGCESAGLRWGERLLRERFADLDQAEDADSGEEEPSVSADQPESARRHVRACSVATFKRGDSALAALSFALIGGLTWCRRRTRTSAV